MPGARVVHMRKGLAPDLLIDATPAALRGVEAAARKTGGWSKLRGLAEQKTKQLRARSEVAECHLSLWCAHPSIGMHCKVKP